MNNASHPFLASLSGILNAESRIAVALSMMNKPDASAELKTAILSHQEDTEGNITGVERIFNHFRGQSGQTYLESTPQQSEWHPRNLELIYSLEFINDTGPPINGSRRAWELKCYAYLHEWDGLPDRIEAADFLEAVLEDEEENEAPA